MRPIISVLPCDVRKIHAKNKNTDILKHYFVWSLPYFYLVFGFHVEWFMSVLSYPTKGKLLGWEGEESDVC